MEMDAWEGMQLNHAKEILAYELTKMIHGEDEAEKAQGTARALFVDGGTHSDMPTTVLNAHELRDGEIGLLTLMVKCGLASSNGEARRLIQQGGIGMNGEPQTNPAVMVRAIDLNGDGVVLQKGKKIFHKVTLS